MVNNNKKRDVGTKQSTAYIKKLIVEEAIKQGVPPELALAVAAHESGFNNIAVSKQNTDGSRDHGVFQLNDKYHKLKNVYDPIENIRYGIGMLKNGLARNKGNVAKTLSDYNAGPNATGKGRRQGDAYAKKVMNLIPGYTGNELQKIAKSSPEATAQLNKQGELIGDTSVLQGGISMQGTPTGAAANPLEAVETGYTHGELVDKALSPLAQEALQNRLQQQYLDYSRDLTPTEQDILNRRVALDPRVIAAADQQRTNALLQAQQNQLAKQENMVNLLNQAYNQYNQGLQNDYRLRNTGYQVTPEELQRTLQLQRDAAVLGYNPVTPMQEAQLRYQTQIANQYGVPYEQYMAAQAEIQANQQKALLQQAQDYITFAKNNGATDQEVIKQLGGSDLAKQLVENQKMQAEYERTVAAPYMTQAGQLRQTGLQGQNQLATNVPQNAVDIAKAQLAASMGITVQQLENALGTYQTDVNAATTQRGQDIGQQNVMIQQPAKNVNAAANLYGMTSPAAGYEPGQQQAIFNALPVEQRNVTINPQIGAEQYNQLMAPQGNNQINTTNPLSFQNLLNRFNRPQE